MNNISKLTGIIQSAVLDYAEHAMEQSPEKWLQDYLGKQLPAKTVDTVHAISGEIIETLNLMEEKKADMNTALAKGQSAENWLTSDIMAESGGNGEKARMAAEFFNGIVKSQISLGAASESEFIEIGHDSTEWQDENWNDYQLKDTLKGIALEAGKSGLREIASDVFLKASEEGVAAAFSGESVQDILINGANVGLKVAVSAGLAIAQESGVIPPTTFQVLATTAHKTVESMSAIGDVIKGKCTMTEALVKIKNTAVATFSGMWKQHKNKVASEIVDVVGDVFGVKGAVIAGAVSGLIVDQKQDESRFVTILKQTGKAALRFLTKEIDIPIFNQIKNKLLT